MRQDVKIGILVGGLVIVAAVIWFVATGGGGNEDNGETAAEENTVSFNAGDDDRLDIGGGRGTADDGGSSGVVTPIIGSGDRVPDDDGPPRFDPDAGIGDLGLDDDDIRVDRDPVTGRGGLPDDDDRGTPIDVSTDPIDDDPIDISSDPIDDPIDDDRDDRVDRGDRDVPETYRVVEGDQGFWGIAKKLYGAGRYYYLIAEANPDVDPTRLRAGQVLRIPPLPREQSPDDAEAEAMADAPSGSRSYTVQAGDAGFWGIAKKLYGAGKYYYLIAEANPDANPARLQPGQVLVIPPLPDDAEERQPVGRADDEEVDEAPTGYRVYIVQEEDQQGFWGIAKKFYGEGSLYVAIERANPEVDSNRLRVGQRLMLPSEAEARRLAGRGSRDDSGAGGADDRPDEPDDLPVFD